VRDDLRSVLGKFLRFGAVGAANSLIYAVSTAGLISLAGVSPSFASALGYLSVLPFAYLVHKSFTFRSQASHRVELWRFLITFVAGLLLSVVLMELLVVYLKLPFLAGIAAAVLSVPVLTLLVLDKWVFRMQLTASTK
jgi:putative flippase GtrA